MKLVTALVLVLAATLCGCGSSPSATAPDFAIQVSQQSVFVPIGFSSASLQVSVVAVAEFNQPVSVSLAGLPPGVTTTPSSPFTISPGNSQTLVFNSTTDVQPAVQQASFQATSGLLSHNAAVSLSIAKPVYAYVATSASGGVAPIHLSGYAVDANRGALALLSGMPVTLTDNVVQMVTASGSGGSFLYALTNTGQPGNNYSLVSYKIASSTGALTPVEQLSFGTTAGGWLAIHPSGKFLYTRRTDANNNQYCVLVFLVDPVTGDLTQSSCTAEDAIGLVIPPPGNFAYLTDTSSSVKAYSVNLSDGSLSLVQAQPPIPNEAIWMYHPSGRALYTTSVAPPYYPNCTDVETWDIDPNSGSLTFVGTYSYYLECWVSLQAFNLAGKFAYSYHHGLYYHDVPGWDLVRVDPNTGGLTSGGYPGYDLPSLAQVEPTQGKYFVGFQSGTINSIPIDPATGLLSSPVANVPPSDPSVSDLVLVAPDNEAPEGRPSLRTLIEICEWAPRRHYGTVGP